MKPYPKIYGPFKRNIDGPNKNKIIHGDWNSEELKHLADSHWIFTEKVDGTNILVHWDGTKVSFGGRTDDSQIPAKLCNVLIEMFPKSLFLEKFNATIVTLYGEGYGGNIQKAGKLYCDESDFVLFDVMIDNMWLSRENMINIANNLNIKYVPVLFCGSINNAIDLVNSEIQSYVSTRNEKITAEGLVGVTATGLLNRNGERIQVKIKTVDFKN